jgi:ubiquitin-associated SH3 domain-containing protein
MNMPDTIVNREGLPKTFRRDSPLTQVGLLQGELIGKGLLQEEILRPGFETYVSPALRSVETAAALLKGMKQPETLLKVEPCLFEWTGWYGDGMPTWVTNKEFVSNGYNVDLSYDSFTKSGELEANESVDKYYNRTYDFVRQILQSTGNDILLVAHGSTLDTATRQLMGFLPRTIEDMLRIVHSVPYAGIVIAEKGEENKKWTINKPGPITLRHSSVNDFDANRGLSC